MNDIVNVKAFALCPCERKITYVDLKAPGEGHSL